MEMDAGLRPEPRLRTLPPPRGDDTGDCAESLMLTLLAPPLCLRMSMAADVCGRVV